MGFGKKILADTTNISLPNIRHGQFMKDVLTEYENRPIRTFELFKQLIKQ